MNMIRNSSSLVLLLTLFLGLSACGGGTAKVVPSDDSADYKSATSLPPLKKTPTLVTTAPAPSAAQATVPQVLEPAPSSRDESLADVEPSAVEQPSVVEQPSENQEPLAYPESDAVDAASETVAIAPDADVAPSISARVIASDSSNARLEIDSSFDAAWSFLSSNLKRSDVTVFSRNKAAGRFSIGCGDMELSPTVVKKGGWSFFNKSKQKRAEYCALSVVERRGKSLVFVLNRDDSEVSNEYSNPLFKRILNN